VKISFIDFPGLWEGRETALSFSALSIDRHFHGRLRCALCRPCYWRKVEVYLVGRVRFQA
jgi:hypothetical protein